MAKDNLGSAYEHVGNNPSRCPGQRSKNQWLKCAEEHYQETFYQSFRAKSTRRVPMRLENCCFPNLKKLKLKNIKKRLEKYAVTTDPKIYEKSCTVQGKTPNGFVSIEKALVQRKI